MDGFSWLILSWIVVGALCYFALNKLGASQTDDVLTSTTTSTYGTTTTTRSQASDWTNELLAWLYSNLRRVPEPLEAWINSLNEAAKKVSSPSSCEILFEGFADNSNVRTSPKVSNIRVEQGPKDHLTVKSTIDVAEVNLKLVSSQRVDDRLLVSNFDAKIRDLHGEVEARLACIANQIYVMGCFSGRPELDIQLTNTDSSSAGEVNSNIVEAAIRRCLVSAVTNISLSESPPSSFSRLHRQQQQQQQQQNLDDERIQTTTSPMIAQEMMRRLNQPHMTTTTTNSMSNAFRSAQPNKVRVKVIRAQRLGKEIDVNQPYVVVEMDEPAQKFTTTKGLNMSPYWEETFEFDFTPASEEILFEIYEGEKTTHDSEPRFLGLAIVAFEEIRRSGENVHTFNLQGRPYRNDNVSGTLTVQFDFYHDPNMVSTLGQQVDQILARGSDGSEFRETLTASKRAIYDPHDSLEGRDVIPTTKTTTTTTKTQMKEKSLGLASTQQGTTTAENAAAVDSVTTKTLDQTFTRNYTGASDGYDSQRYEGPAFPSAQTTPPPYTSPAATTHTTSQTIRTIPAAAASIPINQQQQLLPSSVVTHQMQPPATVATKPIQIQQPGQMAASAQQIQMTSSSHSKAQYEKSVEPAVVHPFPSPTFQEQRAVLGDKITTTTTTTTTTATTPTTGALDTQQRSQQQLKPSDEATRTSRERFKKQPHDEGELPEKRDRSFFGELRQRLTGRRSKRRAKSFDLANEELEEAVSLPPSRDQSRTRYTAGAGSEKQISRSHHETSSVGEKSGISSKSLYQHSTLVLETTKDDKKRYYLIPPSIVDEPAAARLMKHGKKLHIYNEHTFVAVKLRGGTVCNVCHHRIARSFSKQAYQCRDCRLVCHKTCHYKTESYCTASTVSKLDISKDIDWANFLQNYQFEEYISADGV